MDSVLEGDSNVVTQPCSLREQEKVNECGISDAANETCVSSYQLQPGRIFIISHMGLSELDRRSEGHASSWSEY